MDYSTVPLLAQAGFLGIFIAYIIYVHNVDRKDYVAREKAWQEIVKIQRDSYLDSMTQISAIIARMNDNLVAHDIETKKAIAKMEERTRRARPQ